MSNRRYRENIHRKDRPLPIIIRYIGDNPGKTLIVVIVVTFALGVLTGKIFW